MRKYMLFGLICLIKKLLPGEQRTGSIKDSINRFVKLVDDIPECRILELGSRDISKKDLFTRAREHIGLDIHPGRFVNIVGDVHALSKYFEHESFDAVYSISVFEHLAMPWKAVLEINRILKKDGLLFISTHPTYPPHALPWDFWRFKKSAFFSLLNARTGFKIIECVEGYPCSILPLGSETETKKLHMEKAFLGITVLARKTGDYDNSLIWNMDVKDITDTMYPE